MSLYHETAEILSRPAAHGGNLKTRIFEGKRPKSVPSRVYALALETCKWSSVLKEVIEKAELLQHEKKVGIFIDAAWFCLHSSLSTSFCTDL